MPDAVGAVCAEQKKHKTREERSCYKDAGCRQFPQEGASALTDCNCADQAAGQAAFDKGGDDAADADTVSEAEFADIQSYFPPR